MKEMREGEVEMEDDARWGKNHRTNRTSQTETH
jgi:hypothetical protein